MFNIQLIKIENRNENILYFFCIGKFMAFLCPGILCAERNSLEVFRLVFKLQAVNFTTG